MKELVLKYYNLGFSLIILIVPVLGYYFMNWDGVSTLFSMNLSVIFVSLGLAVKSLYHLFANTLLSSIKKNGFGSIIGVWWLVVFLAGVVGLILFYFLYTFVPFVFIETYLYNSYHKNLSTFKIAELPVHVITPIFLMIVYGFVSVLTELVRHIRSTKGKSKLEGYIVVFPPAYQRQTQIQGQIVSMIVVFICMMISGFIFNPQKYAFPLVLFFSFVLNASYIIIRFVNPIQDITLYEK